MHTKPLTTKPTHEVISAIQALDLQSVKVRLMDPELGESWTQDYAESVEAAYKNFLIMVVKYQERAEEIMLAKDVDTFWHTHILQTRKYAADCERVFGTFLHHSPHIGEHTAADLEERATSARQTRALYEREFGDAAMAAWSGRGASRTQAAYSTVTLSNGTSSRGAIEAQNAAWSGLDMKMETGREVFPNVAIAGP